MEIVDYEIKSESMPDRVSGTDLNDNSVAGEAQSSSRQTSTFMKTCSGVDGVSSIEIRRDPAFSSDASKDLVTEVQNSSSSQNWRYSMPST